MKLKRLKALLKANVVVTKMHTKDPRTEIPYEMIVHAVRSLSGEVTQSMRLVTFEYHGEEYARFRFYMDQEPNEDETERGEIVGANFSAGIFTSKLDIEFIVSQKPFGKLNPSGFGIYRRWEAS